MNQDQKKYFRQRIEAIAQIKKFDINTNQIYNNKPKPNIQDYLTKKNYKLTFDDIKPDDFTESKLYFNGSYQAGFMFVATRVFDLTKYDEDCEKINSFNKNQNKMQENLCIAIDKDADAVIDYIMFADEKEALKQLEQFQNKEYKI